jgi:hypothetical protein
MAKPTEALFQTRIIASPAPGQASYAAHDLMTFLTRAILANIGGEKSSDEQPSPLPIKAGRPLGNHDMSFDVFEPDLGMSYP